MDAGGPMDPLKWYKAGWSLCLIQKNPIFSSDSQRNLWPKVRNLLEADANSQLREHIILEPFKLSIKQNPNFKHQHSLLWELKISFWPCCTLYLAEITNLLPVYPSKKVLTGIEPSKAIFGISPKKDIQMGEQVCEKMLNTTNYCCCCCLVASFVFDSARPHGLQPTRLLRPRDFPGKSTGVGCHCLLRY